MIQWNRDDCMAPRVLGLYSALTAVNVIHFLDNRMTEQFPFPSQRIQAGRGGEVFGTAFQNALRRCCIKFWANELTNSSSEQKGGMPSAEWVGVVFHRAFE
jgi:hypothetical protein